MRKKISSALFVFVVLLAAACNQPNGPDTKTGQDSSQPNSENGFNGIIDSMPYYKPFVFLDSDNDSAPLEEVKLLVRLPNNIQINPDSVIIGIPTQHPTCSTYKYITCFVDLKHVPNSPNTQPAFYNIKIPSAQLNGVHLISVAVGDIQLPDGNPDRIKGRMAAHRAKSSLFLK